MRSFHLIGHLRTRIVRGALLSVLSACGVQFLSTPPQAGWMQDFGGRASSAFHQASNSASRTVHHAGGVASNMSHKSGRTISHTAQHAGGVASNMSHKAGATIRHTSQHAGGVASGISHKAGGTISHATQHAGGVASNLSHKAGATISHSAQHAGGVASGISHKAGGTISHATQHAGGVAIESAHRVGGKLNDVSHHVVTDPNVKLPRVTPTDLKREGIEAGHVVGKGLVGFGHAIAKSSSSHGPSNNSMGGQDSAYDESGRMTVPSDGGDGGWYSGSSHRGPDDDEPPISESQTSADVAGSYLTNRTTSRETVNLIRPNSSGIVLQSRIQRTGVTQPSNAGR